MKERLGPGLHLHVRRGCRHRGGGYGRRSTWGSNFLGCKFCQAFRISRLALQVSCKAPEPYLKV